MHNYELRIESKLFPSCSRVGVVTFGNNRPVCTLLVTQWNLWHYDDVFDLVLQATEHSNVWWQVPKEFVQALDGKSEILLVPKDQHLSHLR